MGVPSAFLLQPGRCAIERSRKRVCDDGGSIQGASVQSAWKAELENPLLQESLVIRGVGAILRVAVCYSMDGSSGARPPKTPDRIRMKTKECERPFLGTIMIGLIFFLNYMVSKRPISSLLCNISFIEFFVRGDISNFSFQVLRNIV